MIRPLLSFLLLVTLFQRVHAAGPAGKTQQLNSPDEVPEGLAKSDWHTIRAAFEAGRHAFQPTTNGWQARNPGQQWLTRFDRRGFLAQPRDGGWQWGLELQSYGFPGAERLIGGVPSTQAEGQQLTYGWDATIKEWFVNSAAGLEHGFTLKERPAAGPAGEKSGTLLRFGLAVRGTLVAQVTADGLGVEFRDAAGVTVLNYAGLKVWDVDGKILPSRFEPSDPRRPSLVTLSVDEGGARYPLTIDPTAQQAYLKPAAVGASQFFDLMGRAVAVSGDTVVVGAPLECSSGLGVNSFIDETSNGAGAAYVFVRSGTTWTQQAYLKPAAVGTTQAGDNFGISVAIAGDTVVVGACNENSSSTGVNSTPNESASGNFGAGAAYVFVRSGTTWTQQAYLKPAAVGTTQADDSFGVSVAVSGDTVVVGASGEDSGSTGVNSTPDESASGAGAVYVFVRSGTIWTQQAYLKRDVIGTGFGSSVALSGDTAVASPGYVFVRNGTTWTQQAHLTPATAVAGFGGSVAVSGDTVVASPGYVFVRSVTTWTQQANLTPAAGSSSVAVSGDTVVVGYPSEASGSTGVNSTPNTSAPAAGAAYVFSRSGTNWTQLAYLKPAAFGSTQAGDQFGTSVSVSGGTVVVGAPEEDSSTLGVNSTPNDGIVLQSGAAYTFLTTYSVTYNGNGHTGGTAPIDGSSPYNYGATVTVPAAGTLTRTGYQFTGWNTAADGSGTAYASAATFSITANTVLYAQWNAVPLTGADTLTRGKGRTVKVLMSTLLANDTDLDGPSALTLTAVTSPSVNGATVRLLGSYVVYEADAGDVDDSFTYTVSDGLNTTLGTVQVTVTDPTGATFNIVTYADVSGERHFTVAGVPGRTYRLQVATSLSGPWADVAGAAATALAAANGEVLVNDVAPPPSAFYRVLEP